MIEIGDKENDLNKKSMGIWLEEWIKIHDRTTTLTKNELEKYWKNQPKNINVTNSSLLPIDKKISSTTISNGGWTKSKKQQQKEDRLNKLNEIIGSKIPITLPDDLYIDGLIPVKPLSTPQNIIYYMDYWVDPIINKKILKKKKLNILIRPDKLEYIDKLLKNN